MGSVGAAIAGPLVGGAVSSIFGKKDKDPGAAAYANSAPVQTPGQIEATNTLLPVLNNWMTKPPQINVPKPTQTKITYGTPFGGGATQQTPQQQSFFGGGGFNGPRMPNTYPGMSNPTVGQPQPQPTQQQSPSGFGAGGFSYNPGQWNQNLGNVGIQSQIADLQTKQQNTGVQKGNREELEAQISKLRTQQASNKAAANPTPEQMSRMQMSPMGPEAMNWFLAKTDAQKNPLGPQISALESQLDGLNDQQKLQDGYSSQISSLQEQLGQDQTYQPGTLNIPEAPQSKPTLGTVGTYQPIFADPSTGFQGMDYTSLINQIMNPVNAQSASQNPNGAFENKDYSPQISQIGNYQNTLGQEAAGMAGENLNRNLQQGFSADYLKELAASQIDPLKEAYQEAVRQSTADFNRRGLAGSGFESLDKYGSQNDSITSKFLDAAGNVSRDVALRGAEASREDQYRNAAQNNQDIQLAGSLGAGLSAEQLQRIQAGLGAQMNQDSFNESNRQFWDQNQLNRNQVDYSRSMDQKDLLKTGLTATMQQDAANEANRQRWSQYDTSLAQQNEGNRMSWANLLNGQQMYDQQQQQNDWTRNLDMMKWLTGREDDLTNRQQSADLQQQQMNFDITQQGINNLMSFINGQAPVANNMQQNYWNAFNAQNQQNQQNQSQNQGIANMVSGMFNNYSQQNQAVNNAQNQAYGFGNSLMNSFGVPIDITNLWG